ncbi:MAG: hypothetical protein LBN12_04225 [Clostridiales Family XIII bacterium]|jgi:hypothetical protein|nr:hypothetical protein [Clostridiales Family XIII bacterium]
MDVSSLMGGGDPAQEPAFEYTAQASSPLVSGEVKLVIGENALTFTALFGAAEIPFAEVNALTLADYVVTVRADSGDHVFSRMGNWCQPFYDAIVYAYNKAVLRALFVSDDPVLTAKGNYRYSETDAVGNNIAVSGAAPVQVYESSVVCLPPDLGARRVPLCFVSGLDQGDYELTLRLGSGESYTFAKLGYDTAPFEAAVEKQIRALREKSLTAVKELDPALTVAQASQLAGFVPEGAAAPIGQLAGIAPSFAAALEAKIAETRAAESYAVFRDLGDPAQIYVGFRKNDATEGTDGAGGGLLSALGGALGGEGVGGGLGEALGGLLGGGGSAADGEEAELPPPDPYLLWLIAPSPDGLYAAVEFAEANSATFVYRTGGDFHAFARQLNRALEAIDFKREVIRLTDEELRKPENTDYYMAAKRTAALQFVRAHFAGRVIHSNPNAWKQSLQEYFRGNK